MIYTILGNILIIFSILPNKKGKFMSKNKGFTLAEVLITLGIIGIVAAMTIPTILAKYQEKQTVIKTNIFNFIASHS